MGPIDTNTADAYRLRVFAVDKHGDFPTKYDHHYGHLAELDLIVDALVDKLKAAGLGADLYIDAPIRDGQRSHPRACVRFVRVVRELAIRSVRERLGDLLIGADKAGRTVYTSKQG